MSTGFGLVAFLRRRLWWIVPTAAAALLGVQLLTLALVPQETTVHAVWAYRPKSIADISSAAEMIVRGNVVGVAPGADIVVSFSDPAAGEHRQPTQTVTFTVSSVYKGSVQPGQTLQIFQNGGLVAGTRSEQFIEGDPKYRVGEEYILLLRAQKTSPGLLMTLAPEGRYRLDGGKVVPMLTNSVTADVVDRPVATLESLLPRR